MVEGLVEAEFAAADGEGEEAVGHYPDGEVEGKQQGDVEVLAEDVVGEGQEQGGGDDGGHRYALAHAEGEELVVDVGFVGEEGAASGFDAVDVYVHHVAAGDEQRGKGKYRRVSTYQSATTWGGGRCVGYGADADAEDAQH